MLWHEQDARGVSISSTFLLQYLRGASSHYRTIAAAGNPLPPVSLGAIPGRPRELYTPPVRVKTLSGPGLTHRGFVGQRIQIGNLWH
ncbi:hypothetical protein BST61_g4377 [Cercospora zeina]